MVLGLSLCTDPTKVETTLQRTLLDPLHGSLWWGPVLSMPLCATGSGVLALLLSAELLVSAIELLRFIPVLVGSVTRSVSLRSASVEWVLLLVSRMTLL